MALSHSPKIVTDGLVFCVDAGDRKSYPGSGSTWTDRSGNGYNGALINSPTFSSDNGGVLVFDGSNQYVDFDPYYAIPGISDDDTISELTISVWFNQAAQYSGHKGLVTWWQGGSNTYQDGFLGTTQYDAIRFGDNWINIDVGTLSIDTWYHLTAVKTSTNAYIYLNSDLKATRGSSLSFGFNDVMRIGSQGTTLEFWDGKIANVNLYNKALTADEILQNFNATRGRFGV